MTTTMMDFGHSSARPAARYIMIGGFLGAGKTTAVSQLAKYLAARGCRAGLITNDQGSGLVDTAALRAAGYATEEIAGGCFCCRFDSLLEAAKRLTESTRPEVFVAEPVGSCTDLAATVAYPLRRIYGDHFQIAPLSTLVDPIRAQRVLGLAEGGRFSPKVVYIYRKQLEEANLIVVNKTDLLEAGALQRLKECLRAKFPRARVLAVSARRGSGLREWFEIVTGEVQPKEPTMDLNYDVYADGEALLGWLNATIVARAEEEFDGNHLLREIAEEMCRRLRDAPAEVAHLKMTLTPSADWNNLAAIHLVRNDVVPELVQRLEGAMQSGRLILNLRAEAAPKTLEDIARAALEAVGQKRGIALEVEDLERFRPGRPKPTHRDRLAAANL